MVTMLYNIRCGILIVDVLAMVCSGKYLQYLTHLILYSIVTILVQTTIQTITNILKTPDPLSVE
jgi:hypothetical protein